MTGGFNAKNVWNPSGRGFSMGFVQPEGRVVRLTGQVAWDRSERIVGAGDAVAQTRQCFVNIREVLNEVGGNLSDLVAVTTYFINHEDLPKIQSVRNEFLDDNYPPVSTSIRVAGLGHKQFLVELEPVAVVPFARFVDPHARTSR